MEEGVNESFLHLGELLYISRISSIAALDHVY
jgi:hypothetical protein